MKKRILILLLVCLSFFNVGWFGPTTGTNQVASSDIVAPSSDTHKVGTTSNYFREVTTAYIRLSRHEDAPPEGDVASFDTLLVKPSDGKLYFRDQSGTETALT